MDYGQTFLMTHMSAFPAERVPHLQKELEDLTDQELTMLLMTDIKNPTTALLLGLFLGEFGADRFYIGHKEMGITKLVLTLIGFATMVILIGFFLLFGVFVWKIVDCCLVMGACREANFERLMMQLSHIRSYRKTASCQNAVAEEPAQDALVEAADEAPLPVTDVQDEPALALVDLAEQEAELPVPEAFVTAADDDQSVDQDSQPQ